MGEFSLTAWGRNILSVKTRDPEPNPLAVWHGGPWFEDHHQGCSGIVDDNEDEEAEN